MGSVMIKEDGKYFNRFYFVFFDGSFGSYNKWYVFILVGEERVYFVGKEKLVVEYKGWKICLFICYDFRFLVWFWNIEGYDVLIYVVNWFEKRILVWDVLLKVWVIENMVYCIGVNRVGLDVNNY